MSIFAPSALRPAWRTFYPLLLCSIICTAMIAARWVFGQPGYLFLVWNLILAWVPYIISLGIEHLHHRWPRQAWLLLVPAGAWLAFFPNAPYLVSDFLHFRERPPVPIWYDLVVLAVFAWTGCALAVISLRTIQQIVARFVGRILGWLFACSAILLSGFGVYLGRFLRWNSWDLLLEPHALLTDILAPLLDPLAHPRTLGVTVAFAALMMVCYLTFIAAEQHSSYYDQPKV